MSRPGEEQSESQEDWRAITNPPDQRYPHPTALSLVETRRRAEPTSGAIDVLIAGGEPIQSDGGAPSRIPWVTPI